MKLILLYGFGMIITDVTNYFFNVNLIKYFSKTSNKINMHYSYIKTSCLFCSHCYPVGLYYLFALLENIQVFITILLNFTPPILSTTIY